MLNRKRTKNIISRGFAEFIEEVSEMRDKTNDKKQVVSTVNSEYLGISEMIPINVLEEFRNNCGISKLKRIHYRLKTETLEIIRADKAHNDTIFLNRINWSYIMVRLLEKYFVHDCQNLINRFCIVYFDEKWSKIKSDGFDYITIYRGESGHLGKELTINLRFMSEEIAEEFLKISYSSQCIIVAQFKLVHDSDKGHEHEELIEEYIHRAVEKKVFQKFYEGVIALSDKIAMEKFY